MKNCLFLCLLPLGALGALLGGYRPVDLDDSVIQSRLRPALESNGQLGSLPITKVERQQLFRVTNYRVYQSIPNGSGSGTCAKITCHVTGGCDKPVPCHPRGNMPEPAIKTPGDRLQPSVIHHILGGKEAAEKEKVQGAVSYVVEKMNSMSNNMFRVVPESVSNITQQVVNGMVYRFTLVLVTSQCRNSPANKGKLLNMCRPADNAQRQQCHFAVYKKRSGKYSVTSRQCQQVEVAPKKPMIGGDGHDKCHIYIDDFNNFKATYKRLYGSAEEEGRRFKIFCDNMEKIEEVQRNEQGSAKYGITKFADISEEEFRKTYLTPKWDLSPQPWLIPATVSEADKLNTPQRFDWRDHGAVTPVKNQGSCGSCWAFSTTGNIEGQWAMKSGKLVSLSEQELVDCDKLDQGCDGGLPSNAYQAIKSLGGLETEKDYSYKGEDEKCFFNRSEVAVKVSGGLNISSNEDEMAAWLAKNGPISIGINANVMQFYWGGISHPWKIFCNPDSLDHGVLIVGYDVTSSNEPYWIIKNSWGADWGEKGYYLVYRGSGVCGLNRMCTSAVVN